MKMPKISGATVGLLFAVACGLIASLIAAPPGEATHSISGTCTPGATVGATSVGAVCAPIRILSASTTSSKWTRLYDYEPEVRVPGLAITIETAGPATLDIAASLDTFVDKYKPGDCSISQMRLYVNGASAKTAGGQDVGAHLGVGYVQTYDRDVGTLLHTANVEGGTHKIEIGIRAFCGYVEFGPGSLRVVVYPL